MQQSLFDYVILIPQFLTIVVIPFLLGIAFLIFVINMIRFFVIKGGDEKSHDNAKAQIVYSLAAFILIFVFWGVVEILTTSLGLDVTPPPCPDYLIGIPNSPCSQYR
ncbi:hypothetical protein K2Q16_00505 [Patescibacteria group bacterium]|nr:hypothetical protein [Patescibacteria group bacterium]